MAAPHVTGVVALIRAIAPSLSPLSVWQRLYDTAEDPGPSGWDQEFGEGMVDDYAATGPHVSVDGPRQIPSATSCEWRGGAAGGYGSLTYEWYKNGVLVDTGVSFSTSASSDFHIQLIVTDGQSVQDEEHFLVEIDESAECDA